MSFWGRIWLHLRHILQTPSKGPTLSQINKCCRKSPFPNGNVATRWSCQTDLRHPTLPLGARGHTQGLVTGARLFRLQVPAISRWLSRSGCAAYCVLQTLHVTLQQPADPADLQQARGLCSKPADAASLQTPAASLQLQALQAVGKPADPAAACRPAAPAGNLQTLPHAAPTDPTASLQNLLPASFPACMASSLQLLGHSHRVHFVNTMRQLFQRVSMFVENAHGLISVPDSLCFRIMCPSMEARVAKFHTPGTGGLGHDDCILTS